MTTHLRTRAAQAGAFLALVVGGIATAPAAALAQPPNVSIDNLSPTDVSTGGSVTMQYTVTNTNGADVLLNQAIIRVSGMSCDGDCSQLIKINPGDSKSFTAKLTAPTVATGATQSVTVSITATINGETSNDSQTVTVRGPDKPQTVRQISGKVKDQDGKAISGAAVGLRDSSGHAYGTTTNGSGAYSFTSSDSQPIVPGNITVAAGKDGYDEAKVDVQAAAGRTVNVPLTLKLSVSASTSPSASASASVSATPTEQATDAGTTGAGALPADTGTAGAKKTSQDTGSSMLYIIIGGLLVAAGVGAIVLVMMRRKNNGEDDDGASGSGGVVPPSQGRFNDATQVATPVGAATMVAPRSAAPSISDAPTMLQRPVQPVMDEFPDPYGAPAPQQGGYAAAGGWDDQGGNYGGGTYGGATQYGQPQQEEQYGAYAAGYPADNNYGGGQRYDEPTGMYRPESEQDGYGGYDQAGGYGTGAVPGAAAPSAGSQYAGGYGGQEADYRAGGYPAANYAPEPADQGGYGSWGAPAGGIDSGNAYGPQSAGAYGGGAYGGGAAPADGYGGAGQQQYGGGYEEGAHGGYDDQGGYGPGGGYAGGYDQAGGGRAPQGGAGQGGPGQGGYDRYADDPDGYGQRGGYEEQPSRHGGHGQPAHPGPRRPVEWDS